MNRYPSKSRCRSFRCGLSLLELIAALTILGVVAAAIVPRLTSGKRKADDSSCQLRKSVIEVQATLWYRENQTWPRGDLSDIGPDVRFFPDGLPVCPVDGTAYSLNPTNGRVNGHNH